MKKAMILAGLLASASLHAAVIQQVIVRQQWPWSTDVKVEYKLAEVTSPVDISVKAFNGNTELPLPAEAMVGDLYGISESGIGQFIIDPVKAFGNQKVAIADFRVELELSDSAAKTTEVLYKIIDLDAFTVQDVTRADFMNGKMGAYETDFGAIDANYWTALQDVLIWTGVTNVPAYKTSKLVMRKVPAKNVTYCMGNGPGTNSKKSCSGDAMVTLTNDFYLSVFEVTEGQYKRMTAVNGVLGKSPSSHGDDYPVTSLSYNALRGDPANWTDWPGNQYAVASDTAIAKLRVNMPGYLFDLPTEAQWEYACRAGTTNDTYTGRYYAKAATLQTSVEKLAWTSGNASSLQIGGQKRPNALGLYDMLGNLAEQCRDLIAGTYTGNTIDPPALSGDVTEPYGMTAGTDSSHNINARGGSYESSYIYCFAQSRVNNFNRSTGPIHGFRLWLRAE